MGKIVAFCFLQIERGKRDAIREYLIQLPDVKAYYRLTGEFSGLIEIETEDTETLYQIFEHHIDKLDGIISTQTQVVIKKFSLRK